MRIEFFKIIKDRVGLTNYSIAKDLRDKFGIKITVQSIDLYEKKISKNMRIDVLLALRMMANIPEKDYIKLVEKKFLKDKK